MHTKSGFLGAIVSSIAIFCLTIVAFAEVDPTLVAQRRVTLELELKAYEEQISQYQELISQKQKEGDSLKRDISILDAQIAKAKVGIKARILNINKLAGQIESKTGSIIILSSKIFDAKRAIGFALRKIQENDSMSVVELALTYTDLTHFFNEAEAFSSIQASLHILFSDLINLKNQEEKAKNEFEDQKNSEIQLKALQELEKKTIEKSEAERRRLLNETKGKESEYQKTLKDKQKTAANIRSQLFLLTGSPSISFEKALEYANFAERVTGVRPALLLGVITQETELGKNIGQCLLTNSPNKGDGIGKNTGRSFEGIMKPTRDVDPFMDITSRIGLDPKLMPVSCPQSGGYGGAMGPAQFIPSTWVLFEKRITKLTGNDPPNPWNAKDAFIASALLLKDNGADEQTYNSEWTAAMRYFAGSNWNKKAYSFYGDNVLDITKKYQDQIDLLASLAQR
jgi:membrane-bound lytic murein transglycosylase B